MANIETLVKELGQLTVIEALDLSKKLAKEWNIDLDNIQSAPAQASAVAEEKATATVTLKSFGDKKINVLKVVKEIMGLGLMEAKNFVEGLPKPVVEEVEKEKAEEVKKKLEDAGGTVELS
jgi:large subunit ribosomal protein L7/L12